MGKFRGNKKAKTTVSRDQPSESIPKEHYDEIKKENALFEAYYRAQGIIGDEEWPAFLDALRKPLPATFRVTGHRDEASLTKSIIEERFVSALGAASPRKLEWYHPEGHAWHLDVDRKSIRVEDNYAEFHKWLVSATENGDISRQEAVSMIPPLLMDVKSDHLVLDMCAAPGSKTAQLVEYMHADALKNKLSLPTGLVIANDADQQRAYMLFHQVKRILSPSLLVTNNDGTGIPTLTQMESNGVLEKVYFDRILADVPCSGDGTMRKNALLWKSWTPNIALGLHPLQIRLLEKAVRLLKTGGRIVYSTCSMNLVENEAVVATVLSRFPHALKLVDVSGELRGLKRAPGVPTWTVMNKEGVVFAKPEDIQSDEAKRFPATVFPQPSYEKLGLEHCLRIYPHLQNTGGFFVAVIEKIADLQGNPTDISKEASSINGSSTAKSGDQGKKGKGRKFIPLAKSDGEYRFLDTATDSVLDNIFSFYGIDKSQIIQDGFGFLIRSDREPVKTISIVSPQAFKIFKATIRPKTVTSEINSDDELVLYNQSLKLVNAGVRAFEIYESKHPLNADCPYRLLSESCLLLSKYITKRAYTVEPDAVIKLLESPDSVRLESFQAENGGAVFQTASGCLVPVWINERGVKAFVPAPNRPALLSQLGHK